MRIPLLRFTTSMSSSSINDSIDTMIGGQLPTWLTGSAIIHIRKLHQSLSQQQRVQHQVNALLNRITSLDAFAAPLLATALQAQHDLKLDVRLSQLRLKTHVRIPSYLAGVPYGSVPQTFEHSLLAAALHNFTFGETVSLEWLPGSALLDSEGQPIALLPQAFASLCRALDLGEQYQAHLKARLMPEGKAGKAIAALLEEGFRSRLEATVRLAALQASIDMRSYLQFLRVIARVPVVPSDPSGLLPVDLRVLGKLVRGAVVFEVRQDGNPGKPLEGVIAWIPDDPNGALSRHATWEAFYQSLGLRLRSPAYQQFFQRFISERDRAVFAQTLERLRTEGAIDSPMQLDCRQEAFTGPLFVHMRQIFLSTVLDDAQVLAMPTGQIDIKERNRRLQFYVSAGLDLLGLATFFVPGLGLGLLVISALQIADEVYEGYADWRLGDRQGALDHLFRVAENLALTAITAGAGVASEQLLERTAYVDDLVPLRNDNGQLRLADSALPGYAVEDRNLELGQRGGACASLCLRTHEATFQISEDPLTRALRIVHPQRARAYRPSLFDNGAGNWRHMLETPEQWQGDGLLLRRLGRPLAEVSDPTATAVLRCTGFNQERLRGLHLEHAKAPARLIDAVQRHDLHVQFPLLRDAAFEAHFNQQQPVSTPTEQILRRDFPGLTARCAREIIEQAGTALVEQMVAGQRVPLALAEQARWALRESRLDRACAGLEQAHAVNRDCETVALTLLDDWAPWPQTARVEVRAASPTGELRAQVGADDASELRLVVKTSEGYQAFDGPGVASDEAMPTDSLFQALLLHLDRQQTVLLGDAGRSAEHLAQALSIRAHAQRERIPEMLGMAPIGSGLRPPRRLGDGRLGYPLSGRGESSGQALRRGMRQLYPTFSEVQLQAYLDAVSARGESLWSHYLRLNQHLDSLREALDAWTHEPSGVVQRFRRRQVADRIRRCWRRKTRDAQGHYILKMEGLRPGPLPNLPPNVSFSHVSQLTLRDMALMDVSEDFLRRFDNLRTLDLRDNQLVTIPAGIDQMANLSQLNLSNNRIILDVEGSRRLATQNQLRTLMLDYNPIGMPPALAGMQLRSLALRSTGLTQMPMDLLRHPLLESIDLRDNRIVTLDDEALLLIERQPRRVALHDNPLDAATYARMLTIYSDNGFAPGVRLLHVEGGPFQRERWLADLEDDVRPWRFSQWEQLAAEPGSRDLFRFFADLADSHGYRGMTAEMKRRVWGIIEACVQNGEIREAVFQQAAGPRTCIDRFLLILSALEVRTWVVQRTSGLNAPLAESALLKLGRSLFRLDQVDRIAAEHIERARRVIPFGLPDDVEVYLAYRVGLAESLGLPGQSRYMYFRIDSGVSPAHLNRARGTVLIAETPGNLAASLAARDFWQQHLRATYADRFEALDAPFHERLVLLERQAEWIEEQSYLDQVKVVADERRAAEQQLILTLTRAAFLRHQ